MLEVSHLSKRFGSIQALDSLSLTVGDNELVGFVGANGAGKSTTMRIIMGVLAADAGTVTWRGTTLDADARDFGAEIRAAIPKLTDLTMDELFDNVYAENTVALEAQRRECEIKRLPREKKIALAAHLPQAGLGVALSAEAGIFSRSLH